MCVLTNIRSLKVDIISVLLALWCMIEIKRVIRDKKIIEISKKDLLQDK